MRGRLGVPPNILLAQNIPGFFWIWHGVWLIDIFHMPETPV